MATARGAARPRGAPSASYTAQSPWTKARKPNRTRNPETPTRTPQPLRIPGGRPARTFKQAGASPWPPNPVVPALLIISCHTSFMGLYGIKIVPTSQQHTHAGKNQNCVPRHATPMGFAMVGALCASTHFAPQAAAEARAHHRR